MIGWFFAHPIQSVLGAAMALFATALLLTWIQYIPTEYARRHRGKARQVRAYGGPQFQLVQQVMNRFAEAVEKSQVNVVPKITMGTDGKNGSGLIEGLLGTLLTEKLAHLAVVTQSAPRDSQAQAIRDHILKGVSEKRKDGPKS